MGYRKDTIDTSNLVGFYPLNGTASTVYDYSGNNNDGAISGTPTQGKDGLLGVNVYDFTSGSNYIDLPFSLTQDQKMSYVAWYRQSGDFQLGEDNRHQIISPDSGGYDWSLLTEDAKLAIFTGGQSAVSSYSVPKNRWMMVTGVWNTNTGTTKLYLNDSELIQSSLSTDTDVSKFDIGHNPCCGEEINADIGNVYIFSRALSANEISTLYEASQKTYTVTDWKDFTSNFTDLYLNTSANLNNGIIEIEIQVDSDLDGKYDSTSPKIGLNGSGGPYNITLENKSSRFRANITFKSQEVAQTPVLSKLKIYEKSICDRRGLSKECIVETEKNISNSVNTFNNIFITRESAVLNAHNDLATITVSNESRLSGNWFGNFNISSKELILKPGAAFHPGKRIILDTN